MKTETTRLADRITKGEITTKWERGSLDVVSGRVYICQVFGDESKSDPNAELIAEAFNVTNQCGYTPKELLEQRNEAIRLLDLVAGSFGLQIAEKYELDNAIRLLLKKYQP